MLAFLPISSINTVFEAILFQFCESGHMYITVPCKKYFNEDNILRVKQIIIYVDGPWKIAAARLHEKGTREAGGIWHCTLDEPSGIGKMLDGGIE